MLALLACLALVACFALGLGALGVARVSKQRRGLKSFERSCLRALEPLALPSPSPLRISGLSLLMANQLERALPTAVALSTDKDHGAEDFAQSSKQHTTAPQPQQLTRTRGYDSDNNDSDDSDAEQYDSESDMSDEKDAQRALFDGLQFYTVLSQVGAAAVRQAVDQALLNAHENAARERVRAQQQASIAAIEQRYPDILCLSAPDYQPRTTRADLASALLAVTAAAAIQQQQQQQQQPCSSMQRRLSLKRPESLAFAAEDGLEPMTRTPLTSPNTGSAQAPALEAASFLQAA